VQERRESKGRDLIRGFVKNLPCHKGGTPQKTGSRGNKTPGNSCDYQGAVGMKNERRKCLEGSLWDSEASMSEGKAPGGAN